MLRSVGAIVFGVLADRYEKITHDHQTVLVYHPGALFRVLQYTASVLGCSVSIRDCDGRYYSPLPSNLFYRLMVIIGLFGPAAATALKDLLPYEARGLLSGLFEMGYATGYLLAAVFYRALVSATSHGWRSLHWFGAGPPVLIIIFRWYLPETNHFQVMKAEREARASAGGDGSARAMGFRVFMRDAGRALRDNWVLLV